MCKLVVFLASLAMVSGCVSDPRAYETEPVSLKTAKGVVVCQLYTRERIIWDRSVNRPANMTVEQADTICRDEGRRQKYAS